MVKLEQIHANIISIIIIAIAIFEVNVEIDFSEINIPHK